MQCAQTAIAMSLVWLLLTGCTSPAPKEVSLYLLRTPSDVTNPPVATGSVKIGLGEVRTASYLDEPGIMLELADRKIRPARYHRWAEPLSNSLAVILSDSISADLGQSISSRTDSNAWDYRVDVYVDELHGTRDGVAKLYATWTIVALGSEEADRFHRFSTQERVPSDGYAGLVEAHYRLAEALSTAIANSLRTIAEGRKAGTL